MKTDYKIPVEIKYEINELFAKIKITQKLKFSDEKPLNLEVKFEPYVENIKFSSFSIQMGNSLIFNSKVINKIKSGDKYIEPIKSENTIIYAFKNSYSSNILKIENLQPKEEIIFTTEFIQFIKHRQSYEFTLFTDYPSFYTNSYNFINEVLKGKILIKTINKIIKVKKEIFVENLEIMEEKYLDEENKRNYLITYIILIPPNKDVYFGSSYPSQIYF